jgi:hypothetical protein
MKNSRMTTLLGILLSGCASTGKPVYEKARVVERIADKGETPKWATGEVSMTEENGDVTFANITTMSGNSRPEACMSTAELGARAQMLRHIKENIASSGQVNETSASADPGYESLIAYFSAGKIVGAKISARYWERVEESNEIGERVLRLRCAAKVAVKKSELVRQMQDAIGGAKGGDPKVREALNKATTDFIGNLSGEK